MKKITWLILAILFIFSFASINNITYWACEQLSDFTNSDCMWKTQTLVKADNMSIDSWFKTMIYKWVQNIWWMLWLFSVAMIAYGWLMLTISTGEDEKIKKWKDIVKWWILWFLALVSAWAIITIVINIVFKLGWS